MPNTISRTESLCPVCFKKIEAFYRYDLENKIFLEKECAVHGKFSTLVCESKDFFEKLSPSNETINHKEINNEGCPFNCGICKEHKQTTCCVLLEVTERCNLHCPICFANTNKDFNEDVTLEKISSWYDMFLEKGGPFNIQLSGGEPTMRDDLYKIISIGKEKGFTFFQINTNGIRIGEDYYYLKKLKDAGLNTVFLQFDGFNIETQNVLRGKEILEYKLKAIENSRKLNLGVVLVPTIKKGINDKEIWDIVQFAFGNMPTIRGVHFQPMSFFGRYDKTPDNNSRMTLYSVLSEIVNQSGNQIKMNDFSEGKVEHPYCSFSGNFVIGKDKKIKVFATNKENCCTSSQAREVVSRKWSAPLAIEGNKGKLSSLSLGALDEFLDTIQKRTLSISAMAFQDVWNLDLERLKRCYIHEVSSNGDLVPFCSYNLTDISGESLYRGKEQEVK